MRRGIALGAFVLAAMATGRAITDLVPLDNVVATPFVHDATVGQKVSLQFADVTVTDVRVGQVITGRIAAARAGGRWLVVDTQMTATREPVTLFGTLLDAEGRHHLATDRGEDCTTNGALATGLPWAGSFCFDVAKSALDGATLLIHRGDYGDKGDGFRRDDVARVDLGTTDPDALWARTDTIDVKERHIVGTEKDT